MDTHSKTQGNATVIRRELRRVADEDKAHLYASFFKTGKGEYGEGDIFIGVTVPKQRVIAKKYSALPLAEISLLLKSSCHEERLTALIILVGQYKKADPFVQKQIYNFYLAHTKSINNWDLVDLSAHAILGEHLVSGDRKILYALARSKNVWSRRIAIIATATFIRRGDFADTLAIAEILLSDKHDLIHKAVGWMLREVGKRNQQVLEEFLIKHISAIPRTTLRYAIERLPQEKRIQYLRMK